MGYPPRGLASKIPAGETRSMPFFSTTAAFGFLLAAGSVLVTGSLILFMVLLRDDGPKIGGEREPTPLGWPIDKDRPGDSGS